MRSTSLLLGPALAALTLLAWVESEPSGRGAVLAASPASAPRPAARPEGPERTPAVEALLPAGRPAPRTRARVADAPRLRVLDAETRLPLDGALVRYWLPGDPPRQLTERCDEAGLWSGQADVARPVLVEAPGHVLRDARDLLAAAAADPSPAAERELLLYGADERTLELRVVDAAGGALAGARIALTDGDELVTDARGRARVRRTGGAPSLFLGGTVSAPGYVERPFRALDEGRGELRVWNAGLPRELGEVVLDRAGSVEGRLRGRDGQPIAGAEVVVSSAALHAGSACADEAPPAMVRRTLSDAFGRFAFDDLPRERELHWIVSHAGEQLRSVTSSLPGRTSDGVAFTGWEWVWVSPSEIARQGCLGD